MMEVKPFPVRDFSKGGNAFDSSSGKKESARKNAFQPLLNLESGQDSYVETGRDGGKKGLVETAKVQAEKLLEQARKKADAIREDTYEKAYAQGEKAGYEYGLKKLESILNAFTEAVEKINLLHREMMLEQEKEIIPLILAIARKVIHTEPTINADVLKSVLHAAVEQVARKEDLRVRLNPLDYEFVRGNLDAFIAPHEELKNAVLEADSRVDVGGVIVDHKMGSIDARLARQFRKIEKQFQKIMEDNLKESKLKAAPTIPAGKGSDE